MEGQCEIRALSDCRGATVGGMNESETASSSRASPSRAWTLSVIAGTCILAVAFMVTWRLAADQLAHFAHWYVSKLRGR